MDTDVSEGHAASIFRVESFDPIGESIIFLRNIVIHLQDYTLSQARRKPRMLSLILRIFSINLAFIKQENFGDVSNGVWFAITL
jgi:hypothetical protein